MQSYIKTSFDMFINLFDRDDVPNSCHNQFRLSRTFHGIQSINVCLHQVMIYAACILADSNIKDSSIVPPLVVQMPVCVFAFSWGKNISISFSKPPKS